MQFYRDKIGFGQIRLPFRLVYDYIKAHYAGELRERMIVECVTMMYKWDTSVSSKDNSNDILSMIKENRYFYNFLNNFIGRRARGAEAYNFSLADTSGHTVRLSDFKGKVVLIDSWFTGCTACSQSATAKEDVINEFSNNSNVVFITISIDESVEKWKKSIRSGSYTKSSEINLYTNGKGGDHPFIHYYQIQGFPSYMLIGADGKMFSGNPPVPWPYSDRGKELIKMIKEALAG